MKTLITFRKSIMLLVKALLVASITFGFIEIWVTNYPSSLFSKNGNYVVIFSFVFLFLIFGSLYGAFRIGISRIHEIIYSFSLSIIITNFLMYLELSLIAREMLSVQPILFGTIYQIAIAFLGCWCTNIIYFKLYPAKKMLAILDGDENGYSLINKINRMSERFKLEKGINANTSSIEEIKKVIDGYECVVICDIDKNLQREILTYCYANKKSTYLLPDITNIIINNAYSIQIGDSLVLRSRNHGLSPEQEVIKRAMDLVISAIGLIVASPFMIITAIAIKLDDGGPVFFKQNRITKDGNIFNVLKFRSMIVDADKDGAKKAENDDNRITRVGKIIRACRVDELPQLINVLRGDMSIVGPRPERIENVYEYSKEYPEFELRHKVKGGITGYAQLYGKYNTSPKDKLNMDLMYIENYSLVQDLKLMILTFKVLFMKESTEGFDASANKSVTASKSKKEIKK